MEGMRKNRKTFNQKQNEILPYLAQGLDNHQIAATLNISFHAVYQRTVGMMDISGCLTRDELVAYVKQQIEQEQEA